MLIRVSETGKEYEATLRRWTPDGWEPDCFGDMEPNFPHENCIDEHGYVVTIEKAFNDLVEFWTNETANANEGIDGDGLLGLTQEERDFGVEWFFDVQEV